MKNLPLQLFSLAVAILLSLYVNSEGNSSVMVLTVPVELKNLAASRTIISQSSKSVQVTVRGPSFLISKIVTSPPVFTVTLPLDVPNRFKTILRATDLTLPAEVQVINIEPNEIDFVFDGIVKKEVPVEVARIGKIKDSIRLEDIQIKPDHLSVEGPESELRDLTSLVTYPIDLKEVTGDLEREVYVRAPSRLSRLSAETVTLTLKVSSSRIDKKFDELPIEVRSYNSAQYVVSPPTASLVISGLKDNIGGLNRDQLELYIKIDADMDLSQPINIQVSVPKGIAVEKLEPTQVNVNKKG